MTIDDRAHAQVTPAAAGIGFAVMVTLTAGVIWRHDDPSLGPVLPIALVAFIAVSVSLALVDLATHRLPNRIVVPAIGGFVALLLLDGVLREDPTIIVRGLLGAAIPFAFFTLIALCWPGSIGGGDVKFVAVTGGVTAWVSIECALVGLFTAFLTAGLIVLVMILTRRSSAADRIPFGPYLAFGAWVALLACS